MPRDDRAVRGNVKATGVIEHERETVRATEPANACLAKHRVSAEQHSVRRSRIRLHHPKGPIGRTSPRIGKLGQGQLGSQGAAKNFVELRHSRSATLMPGMGANRATFAGSSPTTWPPYSTQACARNLPRASSTPTRTSA